MKAVLRMVLTLVLALFSTLAVYSQTAEVCGDTGGGAPVWLGAKVVYGRVILNGLGSTAKLPKVTVSLVSGARVTASTTIDRSGNYCFRDVDGSGATLIVEVEGREVGRDVLEIGSSTMPKQFRRDFELDLSSKGSSPKPSVISAKYPYPRNDHNTKLLADAEESLTSKNNAKAEQLLKELVAADPKDFIAWAKLGNIYLERGSAADAEDAFQRSLNARADFAPAMMNLGRAYLMQKRFDQAIDILVKATKTEPASARSFQLLGESYLMVKKGTLGVEALNEAIRLDPVGMAECHLLMAMLYDRAGAKNFASREYRMFLEKVPDHPDAKKFAKYIKDNPDEP